MKALNDLLPDSEKLVPDKLAANILGLTNSKTLSNWRNAKKHPELEYIKIGRLVRYRLGALLAFREKNTVK